MAIIFILSVLCVFSFAQESSISEATKIAVYVMDKPKDSIFLKDVVNHALNSSEKYRPIALDARAVLAIEQKRHRDGSVKDTDIAKLGEASGAKVVCTIRRSGASVVRVSFVGVESQAEIPGRSWMLDLPLGSDEFKAIKYVENEIHKTLAVGGLSNSKSSGNVSKMPEACPSNMVFVKGGSFTMGCTEEQSGCDNDEKPTHKVNVDDFCIGKYEVTQKEWMSVMGTNPSRFKNCGDDCPVENVSWNDIQEYTRKLSRLSGKNYRLPTEAEWEYAARGGDNHSPYLYSGSNNFENVGWYSNNSKKQTHPVGTKSPNELGIYDMSGNVWEWVSDWYGSDYYAIFEGNNPKGPSSGNSFRVFRGGSWHNIANVSRIANRNGDSPGNRDDGVGFRLAFSLGSP